MSRATQLVLAACAALCACAHAGPRAYAVAVAVDCVPPGLPGAPALDVTRAQMRAAPDAAGRMRLAYEFWTAAQPWLAPAEAALEGCRRAAAATPPARGSP